MMSIVFGGIILTIVFGGAERLFFTCWMLGALALALSRALAPEGV